MNKKRFAEGLDSLFEQDSPIALVEEISEVSVTLMRPERKAHGKNFVSDLDALLQEAMEESFDRYEAKQAANQSGKTKASAQEPTYRTPLTGLDALIRQTIDVKEIASDEAGGKKRVTVAVDKPKLDKLKTIARLENSFLKDVLVNVIDEYIHSYSHKKGIDL